MENTAVVPPVEATVAERGVATTEAAMVEAATEVEAAMVAQTEAAGMGGAVAEPMALATRADCVAGREGWVDASDWAEVLVAALVATETRAAAVAAAAESTHTSS